MKCKICGALKVSENIYTLHFNVSKTETVDTPIHQCNVCGVIFRDLDFTNQESYFSETAVYTSDRHSQRSLETRKQFFSYILSLMTDISKWPQEPKILDVGCSYGHFMRMLKNDFGFLSYGVEISSPRREALLEEGFPVFKYASECDVSNFDLILLVDSLYYFEDPVTILSECRQRIADDGIIVIRVTNRVWLSNLLRQFNRNIPEICMGDAKYSFTSKSMKLLLDKTGFEPVKVVFTEKGKRLRPSTHLFYSITQLISKITPFKIAPGMLFFAKAKK